MDRALVYTGQIPLETDILKPQRAAMIGIAKLAQAVLGDGPIINGFDCVPTSPASLDVVVGAGEVYASDAVDATDYSSLLADTAHNILKQGVEMDATTLTITPPTTIGFSRKYLVQVAFSEVDGGETVLPYYNSADPAHGWSGPGNTGVAQYTERNGTVIIQLKAGTAAATGTETAPAPDAGFIPAWIITVDHGDTEINSGDIVQHPDAPIIPQRLPDIISGGGGTVDPATSTPLMDGTAAVGSQTKYARGDHRHPTDTTRAAASAIPLAATSAPLMDSTATIGTSTKYARQDHKHPTDTTRAPLSSPALSGTPTAPTPAPGDDSLRLANTEFVQAALTVLLAGEMGSDFGSNSYGKWYKFPAGWFGGLILQIGEVSAPDGAGQSTVLFPIEFPNACFNVIPSYNFHDGSGTSVVVDVGDVLTTGFHAYTFSGGTIVTTPGITPRYLAIGN